MASSRPESRLNSVYQTQNQNSLTRPPLTSSNTSPIESTTASGAKSPFGSNGLNANQAGLGSARLGAGSPLHDTSTRLFPKRTRELQGQEHLLPGIWGPPTASGNSTPLRENIPESPTGDGFPDLVPQSENGGLQSPTGRARAGTVPSRFSPGGPLNALSLQQSLLSKTSRPTPSTSPFKPPSLSPGENPSKSGLYLAHSSNLSRLRAGSMPQKANLLGLSSPFGSSLYSTNWGANRERTSTLASIRSLEDPTSPTLSGFSKDGMTDSGVKTLDYLGLDRSPQQGRATLARASAGNDLPQQIFGLPMLPDYNTFRNANRFRSYSVNATGKYQEEEDEEQRMAFSGVPSGILTPSAAALDAQLAATQEQIRQHNLAVQAFAQNASVNRPRARTVGMLDTTPQRSFLRGYQATPSRLDNSLSVADMSGDEANYDELAASVRMMNVNGHHNQMQPRVDEDGTVASRSLWIGSIPNSTTVSSLDAIFSMYGPIESTRVLTHKNCGFVNFHSISNAIQAKQLLNGKEIMPGGGPVRIGYAKAPSSSSTPANGIHSTAGMDGQPDQLQMNTAGDSGSANANEGSPTQGEDSFQVPTLAELPPEMINMAREFGASESGLAEISGRIERAIAYSRYESEIPPTPEPGHARMFDAPKLRDIRKRIDNQVCSSADMEETAGQMLPEIRELASDYLGNTVIQKMFEFCSEEMKEQMLVQLAPHLAEIGVHKNGTWAAQKIIDVCKAPSQIQLIVDHLRPYTVPLFLDQYGNYVLQCCLRFGAPFNDFIFETMLSRMWDVAQGRFGARAMRACLESHHASKDQQRMMAAAIALNSVQLATNANGALLLTWFLDTCTFPNRRTVLAPRLVPHLVTLCTHKVAYLTVLKVINQRNEAEARDTVLKALFFSPNDAVLEKILNDQTSGATLIFKVLTTPFFDEDFRSEVVKNVSKVLTKIKAQPNQGYKRLMDEVGLSSRSGPVQPPSHAHPAGNERRHMPHQGDHRHMAYQNMDRQYSGRQFAPSINGAQFEAGAGLARASSADSINFPPYNYNMNAPVNMPFQTTNMPSQLSQTVQPAYYGAQQRNTSGYLGGSPTNGYPGYATPPLEPINYRNTQNHGSPLNGPGQVPSPMINAAPGYQTNFGPAMGGNMYGYPQQGYMPHQQMQPVHGGGPGNGNRRGRAR